MICVCWTPRQLVVTYGLEYRESARRFLREIEAFGYREEMELISFLEGAKVNVSRLHDTKFNFTSSLVRVPEGQELYALSFIATHAPKGLLMSVEPNLVYSVSAVYGATRFQFDPQIQTDYRNLVNAPTAHKKGIRGAGVLVACLDTGIESAGQTVRHGINFIRRGSPADDDNGHGTCVASIINDVAPDVDILPVKIADSSGFSDLWLLEAGILAAATEHAHVTNISMAYGVGSPRCPKCGYWFSGSGPSVRSFVLDRSVETQSQGGFVVASTGNDGNKNAIAYPAACPDAIAVAAVNRLKQVAAFSNEDPKKQYYTAPGGDGQITGSPTEYVGTDNQTKKRFAGTSMAAAYAAGVIALLLEQANKNAAPYRSVKGALKSPISFQ